MSINRFLLTWGAMAIAMTANGIFRETVLVRLMSPDEAVVTSVVFGVLIILAITNAGFRPLVGSRTATLLGASVALVVLTVAFEFAVGRWVDRESWSELAGNYAFWRGSLWPFLMLLLALTPFLWGRWAPAWHRRVAGV